MGYVMLRVGLVSYAVRWVIYGRSTPSRLLDPFRDLLTHHALRTSMHLLVGIHRLLRVGMVLVEEARAKGQLAKASSKQRMVQHVFMLS